MFMKFNTLLTLIGVLVGTACLTNTNASSNSSMSSNHSKDDELKLMVYEIVNGADNILRYIYKSINLPERREKNKTHIEHILSKFLETKLKLVNFSKNNKMLL